MDKNIYDQVKSIAATEFGINIKYRETYKLGTYYGDEQGFYVPHTDVQGTMGHRRISFVVCLSNLNDYQGGTFNFVDLKKEFKFDKGDAIIFRSNLLHGVHPVTLGKRQVLISFMWDDDGEKQRNITHPLRSVTDYLPNKFVDPDYNDKIECPWKSSDDTYFEDNRSDILLVSFAGMGDRGSIPTFIFHNFLGSYTSIDKLFIRDLKCKYYLTGLKKTTTISDTALFLKTLITKKKYKKVFAIGCSAGAYAAILYGNLLSFDKVIAFAPQTVLDVAIKENIIGDYVNAPKTCKHLTAFSQDSFYQKCLDLASFIPFSTHVDVHYPANNIDAKHAERIAHDKCKLFGYDSNNHRIALELRDKGKLKIIIDSEIMRNSLD